VIRNCLFDGLALGLRGARVTQKFKSTSRHPRLGEYLWRRPDWGGGNERRKKGGVVGLSVLNLLGVYVQGGTRSHPVWPRCVDHDVVNNGCLRASGGAALECGGGGGGGGAVNSAGPGRHLR
jgi:hypothetical protein